jgi:hypothetical protein
MTGGIKGFSMRKLFLGLATAAVVALQVSAANAALYNWSFSGNGNSGGGTMTADQDLVDPATFHLTSITGNINGNTISGLDTFDGPDQKIFPTSPELVDTLGFSFGSTIGPFNIYEDDGLFDEGSVYDCGAQYCIIGPGALDVSTDEPSFTAFDRTPFIDPNSQAVAIDFSITPASAVPEPLTLSLFGAGVAGAAALRRRKSRKA